jgi:hypothetical protein
MIPSGPNTSNLMSRLQNRADLDATKKTIQSKTLV